MRLKYQIFSANRSPNSPHAIVPEMVSPDSEVLDVGCNAGYLGKTLKGTRNCLCDGIDIDELALLKARPFYRKLYKIDLFNDNFSLRRKYDYILLIDILEHLPTPHKILQKFVGNLKDEGKIIICLPNIARIEFRLIHLLGSFDYHVSGVMDENHLRFFTLETGQELITDCGLEIKKIIPTGLGRMLPVFPRLFAFQFIYLTAKRRVFRGSD